MFYTSNIILVAYLSHVFLGTKGELKWTGEWISFLDTMLQLSVLRLPGRGLRLPTRLRSLRIDPSIQLEKAKEGSCEVKVDPKMDTVVAGGVELRGKQLKGIVLQIMVYVVSYSTIDYMALSVIAIHFSQC